MTSSAASSLKDVPVSDIKTFSFSKENQAKIKTILAKYPEGRQASAVMPLLDLAQRECGGWLPRPALEHVAEILSMPVIRVYEVASFYSMYYLEPMGKHHIQVCGTTPCMLRGAEDIVGACKKRLGIGLGETTPDGLFTLSEVECLGACANAPMVQINDDYFEDLNEERMVSLVDDLSAGKEIKGCSTTGRQFSCPEGGKTTLLDHKGGK